MSSMDIQNIKFNKSVYWTVKKHDVVMAYAKEQDLSFNKAVEKLVNMGLQEVERRKKVKASYGP